MSRRGVLLDRDGTIIVDSGHVGAVEDVVFLDGAVDAIARLNAAGIPVAVVTNQAGIGRGYYTEADFQALTTWMLGQFRRRGIEIARVYHCPDHPTAGIGPYRRESVDRKPNPGMLLKARDELAIDLARSVIIGDKDSDIAAGRSAGVGRLLKLETQRAPRPDAPRPDAGGNSGGDDRPPIGRVSVVRDLFEAAAWLRSAARGSR